MGPSQAASSGNYLRRAPAPAPSLTTAWLVSRMTGVSRWNSVRINRRISWLLSLSNLNLRLDTTWIRNNGQSVRNSRECQTGLDRYAVLLSQESYKQEPVSIIWF